MAKEIERAFGVVTIPETVDSSMLRDSRSCPRYYYWRHIRHMEVEGIKLAAHFGTCIHESLRFHYLMYQLPVNPDNVIASLGSCLPKSWTDERKYDELRMSWDIVANSRDPVLTACVIVFNWNWEGEDGDDLRNTNRAEALLRAYRAKYIVEPFSLLEPRDKYLETGFFYELVPGRNYYGRIDMPVDWEPYGIVPIDHKTSRDLGASKFMEFDPWIQGDGYVVALRHYYPKVGAVVANVIQNAKTKNNMERFIVPRSDEHLDNWFEDVMSLFDELEWRYEKWLWPRDTGGSGGSCTDWGGCQYRSLCVTPEYGLVDRCDRLPMPGGFVEDIWVPWEIEPSAVPAETIRHRKAMDDAARG